MDALASKPKIVPLSLKDAPSLIERIWPAQKISLEAQKERRAGSGQTLSSLAAYWKGRKPLILARACILGALLPASGDDEKDLAIFEILLGISDAQTKVRFKRKLDVADIMKYGTEQDRTRLIELADGRILPTTAYRSMSTPDFADIANRMHYNVRIEKLFRPEEVNDSELYDEQIQFVNKHLRTNANSITGIVEQLGVMRYGHRPVVGDTFCGGGSIPFEAARIGCDVYASDLNPVACMLTWGAVNIVGSSTIDHTAFTQLQAEAAREFTAKIAALGVEQDAFGNRGKVYLYCLETKCPHTGWMVPLSPSWVISKPRRIVAKLIPDYNQKRYLIEIHAGVTTEELSDAEKGTIQNNNIVHVVDGERFSTRIKQIRGEPKTKIGNTVNALRLWEKSDVVPRSSDVFQERLYCIQWFRGETDETFFAAPSDEDMDRERLVVALVREQIASWQKQGIVPDMEIETGKENEGPIRTMGWTYWHHFFNPRQLLQIATFRQIWSDERYKGLGSILTAKLANRLARNNRWDALREGALSSFISQAMTTSFDYACRSSVYVKDLIEGEFPNVRVVGKAEIKSHPAEQISKHCDVWITDPPYADAVRYEEITEFFIAWLRKDPPREFREWIWDSRRPLAINGDGEEFRRRMIAAYRAMANSMSEGSLQIVMFTHQSAHVWADMAEILWGSGLQVIAAWYIATETTTELKKGGYVQGTVILVLRKKRGGEDGFKDEIVQEVKVEVADQIDTMSGLNQTLRGHGRMENLFEDADLQMAGYAAALRVLTRYSIIDGIDMGKEASRSRGKGERTLVGEIIEFAVQVANEHMVPEGMHAKTWESLCGSERFYFKMMDIESTGAKKLDNYQNFAKAFRVGRYDDLMETMQPNKAALKTARQFQKAGFEGNEFGSSKSRALLYAIYEIEKDVDGDDVLSHLRDLVPNYFNARDDLMALAAYVATKRETIDEEESRATRILHGLIRNERFG